MYRHMNEYSTQLIYQYPKEYILILRYMDFIYLVDMITRDIFI
jgi:hypothetical protein